MKSTIKIIILLFIMAIFMNGHGTKEVFAKPSSVGMFNEPNVNELQIIADEWKSRVINPVKCKVEKYGIINNHMCSVVSHEIAPGVKHYGFIRYPLNYQVGQSYSAILWNHSGYDGVNVKALDDFDNNFLPTSFMKENYIYVVPSYRGEKLTVNEWGTYQSGGVQSIADYDVDDALTLVKAVKMWHRIQDVFLYGQSRGSTVSLLCGIRGELTGSPFTSMAELYGATTCFLSYIQSDVIVWWKTGHYPTDKVSLLVIKVAMKPYKDRLISLQQARFEMIRRSPLYFAEYLPPISFHHGKKDTMVACEHSEILDYCLNMLLADYEAIYYMDGTHNPYSLPGAGVSVESWLK